MTGTDCNVIITTHEVAEAADHIIILNLTDKSDYTEGRVYSFHSQWVMYWLYAPLLGLQWDIL